MLMVRLIHSLIRMNNLLFQPYEIGDLRLKNRIVMAPMTRRRAANGFTANDLTALYYEQRATAGLIISEGSQISPQGYGYMNSPGIYSIEQIEGWKLVTEAVHSKGGLIFIQLWHVGRISHPLLQPEGNLPVAPSAIKPKGTIATPEGNSEMVTPRALNIPEIQGIIEDYRNAAANALKAGFDGVEIHGANGYLIDQFIQSGANHRIDQYGGSIKNRCRFALEVIEAVLSEWPEFKVGIRLSPSGLNFGIYDQEPIKTFSYLINELNHYKLAFLHLNEPSLPVDHLPNYLKKVTPFYREVYKGNLITCGGYGNESAQAILDQEQADLVAFGKPFISNPDLVHRLKNNIPFTPWDVNTFYSPGVQGYTDYPFA